MNLRSISVVLLMIVSLWSAPAIAFGNRLTDEQKSLLFLILSKTNEYHIHNMNGAVGNQVFLHEDGAIELVYDANGNLVKDGINDGSYNYAHPVKDPIGHFEKDIHPWIKWGASQNDPTTVSERIYAYMGDLEGGIMRAREVLATRGSEGRLEASEAIKLPATWRKVLKSSQTHTMFELVSGELEYTPENVYATLKAINDAFDEVY